MRKATRRVRYAARATEPQLGRRARRLADSMTDLQDLLGERRHSVVARQALQDIGGAAHVAGESAFTYGILHGIEARPGRGGRAGLRGSPSRPRPIEGPPLGEHLTAGSARFVPRVHVLDRVEPQRREVRGRRGVDRLGDDADVVTTVVVLGDDPQDEAVRARRQQRHAVGPGCHSTSANLSTSSPVRPAEVLGQGLVLLPEEVDRQVLRSGRHP